MESCTDTCVIENAFQHDKNSWSLVCEGEFVGECQMLI